MVLGKALAFFTIEFGRFGWGRTPKATLPHQRGLGFVRISWGPGSIDQGVLSQMVKDEGAPPRPGLRVVK